MKREPSGLQVATTCGLLLLFSMFLSHTSSSDLRLDALERQAKLSPVPSLCQPCATLCHPVSPVTTTPTFPRGVVR